MVIAPPWQSLLRENHLDSVEAVYQFSRGEVMTRSGTTEVRRVRLKEGETSRTLFIKKYWANHAGQLWSGMLRGTFFGRSKARREFENLGGLRRLGLDAPAPVACGEDRRARWLLRSCLLSEGIPDPAPLDLFIRDHLSGLPREERRRTRRELIERLAAYTRRLHAQRFVHHDYFWRNILLSGRSLERFYLIDAHKGGRWAFWAERRSRAKDLATLDAPAPYFFRRSERLQFYLRYAGRGRLNPGDKELIRLVLRMAAPLRERQLRRVREGRRANADSWWS